MHFGLNLVLHTSAIARQVLNKRLFLPRNSLSPPLSGVSAPGSKSTKRKNTKVGLIEALGRVDRRHNIDCPHMSKTFAEVDGFKWSQDYCASFHHLPSNNWNFIPIPCVIWAL